MTDQELHTDLQYLLVETPNAGSSYISGLWTVAEVSAALSRRQRRILAETGLVLTRAPLVSAPNTSRFDLPPDYLGLRRVNWRRLDGTYAALLPATPLEADLSPRAAPTSQTTRTPYGYMLPEDLTPTLQIRTIPASVDAGVVWIWYIAQGTDLSNTGVAVTIPEELTETLQWGTLADLLQKEGRGYDPERAQVCEQWFQEGLALAQAGLLAGAR